MSVMGSLGRAGERVNVSNVLPGPGWEGGYLPTMVPTIPTLVYTTLYTLRYTTLPAGATSAAQRAIQRGWERLLGSRRSIIMVNSGISRVFSKSVTFGMPFELCANFSPLRKR